MRFPLATINRSLWRPSPHLLEFEKRPPDELPLRVYRRVVVHSPVAVQLPKRMKQKIITC